MQSPINLFFKLGDKATGGDPKKKADFDYYILWIMFVAFVGVFISDLIGFFESYDYSKLGWAIFILCILWFQYFGLKTARDSRKLMKQITPAQKNEKIEDVKDMISGFNSQPFLNGQSSRNKELESADVDSKKSSFDSSSTDTKKLGLFKRIKNKFKEWNNKDD